MKFGLRTPSPKKSLKARTTGRAKRALKKAVNPLYGKKGMGFIKDPKKSVKNAVYHRTTVGVGDIIKGSSSSSGTQNYSSTQNYPETPQAPAWLYVLLIILGIILALLSLVLAIINPVVGIAGIIIGILCIIYGRKKQKLLSQN